jgi:DNA uptake protein ComE-like DNA-binding protein
VLATLLAAYCLPAAGQSRAPGRSEVKSAPVGVIPVDINTASLDELLRIPGMTRVWAARIVRYRPYRTKLELEDHGIVSEEVYERIKDYVIAHRDEK